MFKRIALITLSLFVMLQSFPVSALNLQDYASEEELRNAIVGDAKWVEQFPNGLLNFLGTQFDMMENDTFLEIPIVRQGATTGKVSVDFKAIDISAKYGEDYVIRLYNNAYKNEVLKSEESTPLIETLGDNTSLNISESAAKGEANGEPEIITDETPPENSDKTEETAQTQQDGEPFYTDLPAADVSFGGGIGGQTHSLRQVREAYLGRKSDRPDWKEVDAGTVEKLKSEYDTFLYSMPGTEATIEFEEGEYIKYVYIVALNDKLSESEEQVMLALSQPEGGASRGEFYMSYVNIKDDEEKENSIFEVITPSVTAQGDTATVTVRRKGGLYQYASVIVGTEEGTAMPGVDYEPGLSELLFTPGVSEQSVIINVSDNPEGVSDRYFTVALDYENDNVNHEKAKAVITLPTKEIVKNSDISKMDLDAAVTENTNAEKITEYGYSDKKGTWTLSGMDFKEDSISIYDRVPVDYTSGLKYEIGSHVLVGNAYPISSFGGVNSVSYKLFQTGGRPYSSSFSLDRNNDFFSFIIRPKALNKHYKRYDQVSVVYFEETDLFDSETWKNSKELVFSAKSWSYIGLSQVYNITLNLKQFSTEILQAAKLQKKKYNLINGIISKGETYQEYIPGSLYVKGVYSNVGNYQESPDNPKVYRSDRIEFGYQYSSDNPNGKYASFAGFEIKNGNNWIPFSGTELILNADFFNKTGIIDAVFNGTIAIRPRFAKIPTTIQINFDDRNNGWLENATDKNKTKNTFISFENSENPFFMSTFADIYVGDMLENLTADVTYATKPPVWTSFGGDGYYNYTSKYLTPECIIVTELDANTKVNYVFEYKRNSLELNFREPNLSITANPNTYKHQVSQPVYKLNDTSYTWSEFKEQIDRVWNDSAQNPVFEMQWDYLFNPSFPDKDAEREFGEPLKSYLTVFRADGTQRAQYEIAYENDAFTFSGKPKELGWEIDDFATLCIEGSKMFAGTSWPMKTQEVVIDFLASSRDGIIVSTSEGKQAVAGGIQIPVSIDNANPLAYYKMQSILSPGFMAKWQDKSPDINGDGQYDKSEYEKLLKRFKAMGFVDERSTKLDFLDEKVYYGNNFSYRPGYFNQSKIYYTFERKQSATVLWSVEFGLYENYSTVLNPDVMSIDLPIKDGEVYINGKRIYDDDPDELIDGKYKDSDPVYQDGNYYQGQLFYRGQTYNFAGQAGSFTQCYFTTSSLVKPYDFHAYAISGSDEKDLGLSEKNSTVPIQDKTTKFSYRINGAKAGIVPNDSRIRIYDNDGKVFMDVRTGAPYGEEFSYSLNPLEEKIEPGYTMNISGIFADGEGEILQEFPEVRVGLVFTQDLKGIDIISSFKTPIQPMVEMIGKITNEYDLGIGVVMPEGDPEVYTDLNGLKRKTKTLSFGFDGDYVKEFKEKAKDDANDEKTSNKEELEKKTEDKDKNAVIAEINEKKENPKKKSSGGGDFHMTYEISIAITLELGQKQGEDKLWTDDGSYYFSSLVLMATAKGNYEKSRNFMTPVGIPITVTLSVGGSATAIIAADADHKDPYHVRYKLDGKDGKVSLNPADYDVYTTFIIQPYVTLSAGSGSDDIKLEVSGTADFNFKFTEPIFGNSESSQGSGELVMSAKLKLKILFIEKSWTLYKSKRIDLFSYGKSWQGAMDSVLNDPYQDYLYEKLDLVSDEDIMTRDYISERRGWNTELDEELPQGVKSGDENVLLTGAYPNPNTKLLKIGEDKTLLLFIDDDAARDVRNRASLMYSVIEGQSASVPLPIDADGTWDENPDVFIVGDKVLVSWSDAGRAFTADDTQIDILSSMNISGAWFDVQEESFGEPFEITKTVSDGDNYADLNPKISYDTGTKRLMVYYTKTDYDKVSHDEAPEKLYGDLVNAYSVIAYRYAEINEATGSFLWNETYLPSESLDAEKFYGQRFLSLAPKAKIEETENEIEGEPVTIGEGEEAETFTPTYTGTSQVVLPYDGLDDPRVVEMDLTTHNSLAVLAYIIDDDSDLKTQADQHLFVQTYNYVDNLFSLPIEITNNDTKDTQPRFIYKDGINYLYWLSDGNLVYTNITNLLSGDALKEVTAPGSGEVFYIIDKTNTSRDSHIIPAVQQEQMIDEYQIETDGDCVYAFWTEDGISYKNGLKKGDEGTDDPGNINMERQIFAACTVPQTEGDESFPWSKPVQVTTDEGQSFSDLSFAVTGENVFTIAYARHNPQYDPDAECFTSTGCIRTLAVNTYVITNDLELGDISLDKEFPLAGQSVSVTTQVKNTGLKPFEGYETQVFATYNGQTFYEGEWVPDSQGGDYILGGDSETVTASFVMPDDLSDAEKMTVGFRVKSEDEILTFKEESVSIKPDILLHILESKLIDSDKALISFVAENNGNKAFRDVFTVSAGNKVLQTKPIKIIEGETRTISLEVNLNGTSFGELQTAEDGSRFDLLPITLKFGEFEASKEIIRQVSADANKAIDSVESFYINKDGKLLSDGAKITMGYNDIVTLKKQIEAAEEEKTYPLEVVYKSSAPEVVSVLSNGLLVPMSAGTATITAHLQPESEQSVSYEDGTFEVIDTPYTVPDGVKKKIALTVNVKSGSSGGSYTGSKDVSDESLENKSFKSQEKTEGEKLILSVDEKLFAKTLASLSGTLVVDSSGGANAKQVEVTLTAENLNALAASKINRLTINSIVGNISLDRKAIDGIMEKASGKSVVITLDNKDNTFELTLKTENDSIDYFGGNIFVSIPHTPDNVEDPNSILVYQTNESETIKPLIYSLYDLKTGRILFMTGETGRFIVKHNKVSFSDDLSWAKEYIDFLAARDIVKGISEGIFDKDRTLTRAEFVTMLSRLDNTELTKETTQFKDVPSGIWYEKPVQWALLNLIATGTSYDTFSPDKSISREEMATMLYRYLAYAGCSLQKGAEKFEDSASLSEWAREAIDAMRASEIMVGTGENKFEPHKISSRAEAAKVVAKIIKYNLK